MIGTMSEEQNGTSSDSGRTADESRPIDLGLSEGKSMAFAPTSALQPEGQPIGGLAPAGPSNGTAPEAPQGSSESSPAAASAGEASPSGDQDG